APPLGGYAADGPGSLSSRFLQLSLVLGHLLARLAAGERREDRPEQAVSLEGELDRHLRAALADGPYGPAPPSERHLARRVVLSDLVGDRLCPARHAPDVGGPRPHPGRAVCLPLAADDLRLPFAVPLEVVQVGEHVLETARDLDAVRDLGQVPILSHPAAGVNPPAAGADPARG